MQVLIDYISDRKVMVKFESDRGSTAGASERVKHWRYSSAKDYVGIDGILEIERVW